MKAQPAQAQKQEEEYLKYIDWLRVAEEVNDAYFEVIEEIMPLALEFAKQCRHKATFYALLSFYTHLSTIKNALLTLSAEENFYSTKILYRVYLEHWLKAMYIWTRYTNEQTDNVGTEYNSLGRIGEELKYGNSTKEVLKIIQAETSNLDVWDLLCKYNPALNSLNKTDIKNNLSKFKYTNIAKYLIENKAPGSNWVSIIIPEYSELSSFVHGGPSATNQYASVPPEKMFEEYKGMIRFAFNTSRLFAYSVFVLMYKDLDTEKKDKIKPLLFKLQTKEDILE
jgi:hypothetical protein